MKKLIIALEEDIHKKAKIIALLKDISLNRYILDSLDKAISQDQVLIRKFKNE